MENHWDEVENQQNEAEKHDDLAGNCWDEAKNKKMRWENTRMRGKPHGQAEKYQNFVELLCDKAQNTKMRWKNTSMRGKILRYGKNLQN